MIGLLLGAWTALGLGMLTVIHPCPLSTNIAAVSLLIGWQQNSSRKIVALLLFVAGEILTFVLLGIVIASGLVRIPIVANILQIYMRQLLGPLFIIIGMMLAGILLPKQQTLRLSARYLKSMSKYGLLRGLTLGILIALSFCPLSAAMFFGMLIPLAISSQSTILYPVFFGMGTSLPLLVLVTLVSRGALLLDQAFLSQKSVEPRLRTATGMVVILVGIFMSLRFIFMVI